MVDFKDKTNVETGTPINRKNMMALQGFYENSVEITEDENGNITIRETNENGQILTVNYIENEDGSITIEETFSGEKTISQRISISADGNSIQGVLL